MRGRNERAARANERRAFDVGGSINSAWTGEVRGRVFPLLRSTYHVSCQVGATQKSLEHLYSAALYDRRLAKERPTVERHSVDKRRTVK